MAKTNKTEQSKKAMLSALEKSLGVVTSACRSAGVSRTQFYQWMKDDPDFQVSVIEIENIALDFVESQLHKQIGQGTTSATIFFLKCKGRKRGYIEKHDYDINQNKMPDFSELSTEEILALLEKND